MGKKITLTAADQHQFSAYRADPATPAKGAIIVLQEIFGVNNHIRSVCDRFAQAGYVAIAPALFDRKQRNLESGYSAEETEQAIKFAADLDWSYLLKDVTASFAATKNVGPVAVVGFCLGGSLAYRSAIDLPGLSAAVCYYGGRIAALADQAPRCPTLLHFGEQDSYIPQSDVETIRKKRSECEIFVYPDATHGFNCDERSNYHLTSAKLAWERTLTFLAQHML